MFGKTIVKYVKLNNNMQLLQYFVKIYILSTCKIII